MFIKEIRIRNFRSILRAEILLNSLSIFVGQNDVGKSNILKALNLFFNGFTDYSTPFNFAHDFCKYTNVPQKKAPEIVIELVINAPSNYKESKDVVWRRIWRRAGFFDEKISFYDGTTFPKKSKLYSWLQNLRFNYIPAIRGNSYFEILLAQLHDTLVETVEGEIRSAGDQFIEKIENNTKEMILEINKRIRIDSKIRFPSNLQALFRTLEFSTIQSGSEISLVNRGDGIKTRHIPVILKFIADQLNVNKVKGSPNVNMIWGYEEPENNLEMKASFALADDFIEYAQDLQLLVTTHSPSFYALRSKRPTDVNLFRVLKDSDKPAEIQVVVHDMDVNEDMGILPIVTPYIEQKVKEIKVLGEEISEYKTELKKIKSHALFVEGRDEVRVFENIIENEGMSQIISVKNDGLGCSGVKSQIMAWAWVSATTPHKAIGIFDNDQPGNRELAKLREDDQFKSAQSNKRIHALVYKVPTHLHKVKRLIPNFPIEVEEMYIPSVWHKALEYEWLEERDPFELSTLVSLDHLNQTIHEKIDSMGFNVDELVYVRYKVPDKHKEKLSKYCCKNKDYSSKMKLTSLIDFFASHVQPFFQ
ncbi:MAG: ATP-dependent nuclease [Cyclobacteriaceae bacterium]|jgi:AAA15 family ATPase/GTPase